MSLLTNSLSKLARMLTADDDPPEAPEAPEPDRSEPSKLETLDFSFLTLDELVETQRGDLGTRLFIITLRSFKAAIGDEWDRHVQRIHLIVEGVVSRYLGPRSTIGQRGDDTFILSFSGMSAVEGRKRTNAIVADLMRKLIGERFQGATIGIAEADPEMLTNDDGIGGIDEDALQAVLDAAIEYDADDLDGVLKEYEGADWDAQALEPRDGNRFRTDFFDRTGPVAGDPDWQPLVWPPEGTRLAEDLGLRGTAAALPDGMEIAYRPALDLGLQRSETCIAVPVRRVSSGEVKPFALPEEAGETQVASLDLATVFYALRQLEQAIEDRHGVRLVVPIRYATVRPPHLDTLLSILRHYPPGARGRYLVLEITAVPKDLSIQGLTMRVSELSNLSRGVWLRVSPGGAPIATLRKTRPGAIGIHMRMIAKLLREDPKALERLRGGLGAIQLYGVDANTRDLLGYAHDAKLAVVTGSAVGPLAPRPTAD